MRTSLRGNTIDYAVAVCFLAISAAAVHTTNGAGAPNSPSRPPSGRSGRVSTTHLDLDLIADEDTKIRRMDLPVLYDEKGKSKKYSAKDLSDLKGPDRTLPGYTGTYIDLKKGQVVTVFLLKKKENPKTSDRSKEESAKDAWAPAGEIGGALTKLKGSTKKMTIRTQIAKLPGAFQGLAADRSSAKTALIDLKVRMIVIASQPVTEK